MAVQTFRVRRELPVGGFFSAFFAPSRFIGSRFDRRDPKTTEKTWIDLLPLLEAEDLIFGFARQSVV